MCEAARLIFFSVNKEKLCAETGMEERVLLDLERYTNPAFVHIAKYDLQDLSRNCCDILAEKVAKFELQRMLATWITGFQVTDFRNLCDCLAGNGKSHQEMLLKGDGKALSVMCIWKSTIFLLGVTVFWGVFAKVLKYFWFELGAFNTVQFQKYDASTLNVLVNFWPMSPCGFVTRVWHCLQSVLVSVSFPFLRRFCATSSSFFGYFCQFMWVLFLNLLAIV